jgi:hypothetical protein
MQHYIPEEQIHHSCIYLHRSYTVQSWSTKANAQLPSTMSVEVIEMMMFTFYHTPPKRNRYLRLFLLESVHCPNSFSMYVQLVSYSGQWQDTVSYSRTMDTALKPHKYNFVCKLPWTIPSVKSKFTVLCKNITMLKFRLCHTGHKYCFGSFLSFFLSSSWNTTWKLTGHTTQ